MTIADCDAAIGQELNIATGREISIGDLADEADRPDQSRTPRSSVRPSACAPEKRAKSTACWATPPAAQPDRLAAGQYTSEQGLAATIEFLRGNLDQYKVGQYIL